MRYDERELLIKAMSVHFGRPRATLRMFARQGGSPWNNLVTEFYRANTGWTLQNCRTYLVSPPLSGEDLNIPGQNSREDMFWTLGCGSVIAFVVFLVWVLYQFASAY